MGDLRKKSSSQLERDLKFLHRRADELEGVNSALKRSVETLLDNENRYEMAIASASAGIWEYIHESEQVYMDSSLRKLLGLSSETEVFDVDYLVSLLVPGEKRKFDDAFESLINSEVVSARLDVQFRHSTLGVIWLGINGSVALNSEGEPVRVIGICMDITRYRNGEGISEQAGA